MDEGAGRLLEASLGHLVANFDLRLFEIVATNRRTSKITTSPAPWERLQPRSQTGNRK